MMRCRLLPALAVVLAPAGGVSQDTIYSVPYKELERKESTNAPGAERVIIFGQPTSEGMFSVYLTYREGTRLGPHTHPTTETTLVLSGVLYVGTDNHCSDAELTPYAAGSFFVTPANTVHCLVTKDAPASFIAHGTGPTGIEFIMVEEP